MKLRNWVAGIVLTALTGTAQAASVGFTFELDGSGDVGRPFMIITNTGLFDLTSFAITIGDTAYNYDFISDITVPNGPVGHTLLSPDTGNNGVRSDGISLEFSQFAPAEIFSFRADIDHDTLNIDPDFTTILFNNGAAPNAELSAGFANGGMLSFLLPEDPAGVNNVFTFVVPVPLPPAFLLLFSALAALALTAGRTRARI